MALIRTMNGSPTSAHETCISCHAPLKGRRDKRFCDDSCRSRHHRIRVQNVLRDVDHVLHNNRALLKRLRSDEQWTKSDPVSCFIWLRRAGFDFNFHTHVAGLHDGRLAVMCYEEGFVLEGGGVQPLSEPLVGRPMVEQSVAEPGAVWCDLKQLLHRSQPK